IVVASELVEKNRRNRDHTIDVWRDANLDRPVREQGRARNLADIIVEAIEAAQLQNEGRRGSRTGREARDIETFNSPSRGEYRGAVRFHRRIQAAGLQRGIKIVGDEARSFDLQRYLSSRRRLN